MNNCREKKTNFLISFLKMKIRLQCVTNSFSLDLYRFTQTQIHIKYKLKFQMQVKLKTKLTWMSLISHSSLKINYTNYIPQIDEVFNFDCLGQHICKLFMSADMKTSSTPFRTWLRKKWYLVSMCPLIPCNIGFLTRFITYLLSIINLISLLTLNFSFCSKFISQTVRQADKAPVMFSASQVDNATNDCFLEH